MSLSRKHFVALAAIVADLPDEGVTRGHVAAMLADWCATENPNFDRIRFIEACLG